MDTDHMTPENYKFLPSAMSAGEVRQVIVTAAIGGTYFQDWHTFARPSWERYAESHKIGIVVYSSALLEPGEAGWKHVRWHKWIAPSLVGQIFPNLDQILMLDSDVLISPAAPNVFDAHDRGQLGVVSNHKVPFDKQLALRRVAFLRHHRFSNRYPLDSSLFIQLEQEYLTRNLVPQDDYFTSGFMLMNATTHPKIVSDWLLEVSNEEATDIHEKTGQWEQPYLAYKVQSSGLTQWLDYKWQAIWVWEAARKFPVVFDWVSDPDRVPDILRLIEYALWDCYFLHFAGSWPESELWKLGVTFDNAESANEICRWESYLKTPLSGKPVGKVRP